MHNRYRIIKRSFKMAKGASKPSKGIKKAPSKDKAAKEKKVY